MKKKGITMTSVVVYVALFFVFTSIAVAISSSMNYEALNEKGNIINNKNIQKLQFNLLNSAKNSIEVFEINGKIVFSNNDEYYYDNQKKRIIKNDATLIQDVENFEIVDLDSENFDKEKSLCVRVKLKKYGIEKEEELIFSVGD